MGPQQKKKRPIWAWAISKVYYAWHLVRRVLTAALSPFQATLCVLGSLLTFFHFTFISAFFGILPRQISFNGLLVLYGMTLAGGIIGTVMLGIVYKKGKEILPDPNWQDGWAIQSYSGALIAINVFLFVVNWWLISLISSVIPI
jgi:hypothetical protein